MDGVPVNLFSRAGRMKALLGSDFLGFTTEMLGVDSRSIQH